MAVMIYQYIDEIIRVRHTNNSLLVKPYPSNPEELNIIAEKENSILE